MEFPFLLPGILFFALFTMYLLFANSINKATYNNMETLLKKIDEFSVLTTAEKGS